MNLTKEWGFKMSKAYYRNKAIDNYFSKLLKKGFKRENLENTVRFSKEDNGFKRTIEIEKKAVEFREIKPRLDRSLEFEVV